MQLAGAALGDKDEVAEVFPAGSCGTLGDIAGDARSGTPHLGRKSKEFVFRKLGRDQIDEFCELDSKMPNLQISERLFQGPLYRMFVLADYLEPRT